MNLRVERLRERLPGPLLVTDSVNVRYLTGLKSSNAAVLVGADRVRVFTDFRYREQATALGLDLVEVSRNLLASAAPHLPRGVAFEAESVTYAGWETLRDAGLEPVPTRGLVQALRAVKDPDELDAIRRAAAVTDRVFARFARERFGGQTERQLVARLEALFREEGAHGLAFDAIVAAGPNAANPHVEPGDSVVEPGQTVVVDAGATVDGYRSDCTRTFAVGPLPERLRRAYDVCLEAQLAALAALRPGVAGAEADAVARRLIDGTDFRGLFGHGLGHGVGMDIHEAPTLRRESEDVLAAGNVVTVEPGIYVPGEGGVRIEDLVIVHEHGTEILTPFTKQLVEVA